MTAKPHREHTTISVNKFITSFESEHAWIILFFDPYKWVYRTPQNRTAAFSIQKRAPAHAHAHIRTYASASKQARQRITNYASTPIHCRVSSRF